MSGETDLGRLLQSMQPDLVPGEWVFATLPDRTIPDGLDPVGTFHEPEGLTVIIRPEDAAVHGLTASAPMRQITLTIHSSLEAVGLTGAFATELARHGISANVVAGFYHDHIFVGAADADRAMAALTDLAARHHEG